MLFFESSLYRKYFIITLVFMPFTFSIFESVNHIYEAFLKTISVIPLSFTYRKENTRKLIKILREYQKKCTTLGPRDIHRSEDPQIIC